MWGEHTELVKEKKKKDKKKRQGGFLRLQRVIATVISLFSERKKQYSHVANFSPVSRYLTN